MSEREELICILDERGAQAGDCGHEPGEIADCPNECREILEGYAEAILAAGYRKPRVVTTVEELYELPIGSAIVDATDLVYVRDSGGRKPCKVAQAGEFAFVSLPAMVLYEGSE